MDSPDVVFDVFGRRTSFSTFLSVVFDVSDVNDVSDVVLDVSDGLTATELDSDADLFSWNDADLVDLDRQLFG